MSSNAVKSGFRLMFLRNLRNHPVGCLAIKLNREQGIAEFQVSTLNPKDEFNRSLSRQLAIGRLVEKPLKVEVGTDPTMHTVSHAVMTSIAKNASLPKRSQQAAALWLSKSKVEEDNPHNITLTVKPV